MDTKIEDAICRVLQGLEKYRDAPMPPMLKDARLGTPRYKRWSKRKTERLLALWKAGVPRKDIPSRLGATPRAVDCKLQNLGLKERDRKRARLEVGYGG